jgi:hypothetical protein
MKEILRKYKIWFFSREIQFGLAILLLLHYLENNFSDLISPLIMIIALSIVFPPLTICVDRYIRRK